jgi:hypothetical protein
MSDALNPVSRAFFERTKVRSVLLSILHCSDFIIPIAGMLPWLPCIFIWCIMLSERICDLFISLVVCLYVLIVNVCFFVSMCS